ncbi:MAG: hypothetical protein ABW061_06900 [Polyangiaceae bacterium]
MNAERETSDRARETALQTGATSGGVQYAKAPSMLWFIVPMAVLLAYGFLSR